MIYKADLI